MKSLINLFSIMFLGLFLTNSLAAQENTKTMTWDEAKEAYHEVMAVTFHPAEEGDLQPVKDNYKDLAMRSKAWAAIAVPEDLNGKALEKELEKLVKESVALGDLVKKEASDDQLKKAIFALHDVFHTIVGMCDH